MTPRSRALLLCPFVVSAPFAHAQSAKDAAALLKSLDKLQTVGSVLYIAAHPDDENTAVLATLSKGRNLRTAYLALTRGGGGQNLIGSELDEGLAAIRTQELLAARRIDGAEQFFSRAVDFGFSKTAEETLRFWGKDAVLGDVVRTIRTFRPDVILTRFPPDARAGHGHHTASAMLAIEAFKAAADPTRFPDQIQAGLRPWQAKRLLWNHFRFSDDAPKPAPGSLTLEVGAFDPILGTSFGELAAESRSQHRSQGFGVLSQRGSKLESFELLAGEPAKTDLFEGVDLSWARVPGASALASKLNQVRTAFRPDRPAASLPLLLEAQQLFKALPAASQADPLVKAKALELSETLRAAAGLWVEALAERQSLAPGDRLTLSATVLVRGGAPLRLSALTLESVTPEGSTEIANRALANAPLEDNTPRKEAFSVDVPAGMPLSQPHWLGGAGETAWAGQPENPNPFRLRATLSFGEQSFDVLVPVQYRFRDPVLGERYQPVVVVPPAIVTPVERVAVFGDEAAQDLHFKVVAGAAASSGKLRVKAPAGWRVSPMEWPFQFQKAGEEKTFTVRLTPPTQPSNGSLQIEVSTGGGFVPARGLQRLDYPHIPLQTLLPATQIRLARFDLRHNGRRIGYVMGAGDEIPQSLRRIGYEVDLLSDEALASSDLSRFDAIVLGIRAFNTRAALVSLKQRLHEYVAQGGTEVVLYTVNTGFPGINAGMVTESIGPYPFKVSRNRVTDEHAEVRFLLPDHPALNWPNKLTAADFEGWVQERSLYHAEGWDAHYRPLFAMHDPGEKEDEGSLIIAEHGKGRYVYTGLAFFRQLPDGVPGAYRLFANLLALGHAHD
jgi:LmbE family N-acetylglucosaminyl deacetylase